MDKIIPRTVGQESMTQDNVVKQPVYMGQPENIQGNESGVSTTAGLGAVAVQPAYSIKDTNLRNSPTDYTFTDPGNASSENRSAQYKNPSVKQDVPSAAQGQYQ